MADKKDDHGHGSHGKDPNPNLVIFLMIVIVIGAVAAMYAPNRNDGSAGFRGTADYTSRSSYHSNQHRIPSDMRIE